MKKYLITLLFATGIASAQETPVKQDGVQNTGGVQTGFLGIWVYQEFALTSQLAARIEGGFDIGFATGPGEDTYGLIPTFRLEPRWYYNLARRESKGRDTQDNAGNFVALNLSYVPDVFIGSNPNDLEVLYEFLVIPKWAIKRNLGQHFNYEAGIGLGYVKFRQEYLGDMSGVYPDIHLRIGYKF